MNPLPQFDDLVAGRLLSRQREIRPNRLALRYGDRGLTYAELDYAVNRTANGLAAAGVKKSQHVGLMMDNRPEFIVTVYALARLGAVCVPFNTTLFGTLLSYFVEDSDISAVVAHARHAKTLAELPAARQQVKLWVVADPAGSPLEGVEGVCTTLDALQEGEDTAEPSTEVLPSDPLMMMYTSGTTGPSKGIISPHSHVVWAAAGNAERWLGITPEDNFYSTMPLFHVGALWYSVGASFWAGAGVTIADRFSASNYWKDICETGSTVTIVPPTMWSVLEKLPPSEFEKNNTLRIAWVTPLPTDLRKFEQRFHFEVATHFSMTEISPAVVGMPGTVYDKPQGCAGRPTEEWDVMIADPEDRSVPAGTVGEILVRPRVPGIIFQGYHRKERQTVAAWRNLWFHTGDRGYFDAEGFMYFVDRAKDSIRRRGENISAEEIEKALAACEGVQDVAAVPVPSPLGEDDVCVYVTRKDGCPYLSEETLVRHAQAVLPYFMVPRYVAIVADLPRTPTYKVQKFILRQWASKTETLWDAEQHGIIIQSPDRARPRAS